MQLRYFKPSNFASQKDSLANFDIFSFISAYLCTALKKINISVEKEEENEGQHERGGEEGVF